MKKTPIFLFIVIAFFISFADGLMSYISPVFIESKLNSAFLMGIIFSFSSVVGIICDLIFPKIFHKRPHYFFLKATLLSAVMFPLTYLLFPNNIFTFLIAMTIWGIYYELNIFSSFHFVHTYVGIDQHTRTWGIIQSIQNFSYALAPLLAIQLLSFGYNTSFVAVCFILFISIIPTLLFKNKFVKDKPVKETKSVKSWIKEIKIWKLLFPKVWHLLILQIIINVIDSGFWTIGTLFTQELNNQHHLGGLFLTAYIAPSIIAGFLLGKANQKSGKKKLAIISSMIAGLSLSSLFLVNSVNLILTLTAITSFFIGAAVPELKATFEDYVSRLKEDDNEMIGLQSSSTSFAYVIGPIMSAYLAGFLGYKTAFSILGLIMLLTSIILIFIIPKKIKMPQKELAKI